MAEGTKVEITPAKGRPMLTWVGKRALRHVVAFPAQLIELYDPTGDAAKRNGGEWQDCPSAYPKGGLLFHGDNKEVLAHLLANGFRGKVKLIYIDPPFDSGADYVRKVTLRGVSGAAKIEGETYTLGEQVQYTDMWANDNYLQFVLERLLLLKELLTDEGNIFLHCDYRKCHHLRCIMDEVFGADYFRNEIVREKQRGGKHHVKKAIGSVHDTILHYSKGDDFTWRPPRREIPDRVLMERYPYEDDQGRYALADCRNFSGVDRPNLTYEFLGFHGTWKWTYAEMVRRYESGEVVQTAEGNVPRRKVRRSEGGDLIQSLWYDVHDSNGTKDYPTEKSEELLERIIRMTTDPGDIVLDAFLGSGTTVAVAQRTGRRWIGCDINKGAIQTTSKRLQTILSEQIAAEAARIPRNHVLLPTMEEDENEAPRPAQLSVAVYRVNDYNLQIQHNEAVNLACEHIGVTRTRADSFFDGVLGKRLVKIIPFNHPLTPLDLEGIKQELSARPEEERDIVVVCLGKEIAADVWLEEWNRLRSRGDVPNKIEVIELRTDPKYGRFLVHQPAHADVSVRRQDAKILVEITNFLSPTVIERLQQQAGILKPQIDDWRAMVDAVMIDPAYDGTVFRVLLSDIPQKKNALVSGRYELNTPADTTTVAVKIIDVLGEEILVTTVV